MPVSSLSQGTLDLIFLAARLGLVIPIPRLVLPVFVPAAQVRVGLGPFMVIGTVVIPGIAFTALLFGPLAGSEQGTPPLKRPIATGLMVLTLVAMVVLTWEACGRAPENSGIRPLRRRGWRRRNRRRRGSRLYGDLQKSILRPMSRRKPGRGKRTVPARCRKKLKAEEIIEIIDNGRGAMPPRNLPGNGRGKEKLAEWLAKQK